MSRNRRPSEKVCARSRGESAWAAPQRTLSRTLPMPPTSLRKIGRPAMWGFGGTAVRHDRPIRGYAGSTSPPSGVLPDRTPEIPPRSGGPSAAADALSASAVESQAHGVRWLLGGLVLVGVLSGCAGSPRIAEPTAAERSVCKTIQTFLPALAVLRRTATLLPEVLGQSDCDPTTQKYLIRTYFVRELVQSGDRAFERLGEAPAAGHRHSRDPVHHLYARCVALALPQSGGPRIS